MTQQEVLITSIREARAGRVAAHAPIQHLLDTVVVVPSSSNPVEDGFRPLIVAADGTSYAVVVTDAAQAARFSEHAQFAATLLGADVVRGLADGIGVVLNPDGDGFLISPELAASIRRSL